MGKQLVNNIRGINPLARKGTLLLLAFLVSFACLLIPRHSEAAVVNQTQWAIIGTGTTNTFPAMTLAKGAGTERLLVVQVVMDYSGNNTGATPTVTYGGQTLTQIVKSSVSQRQHIWLGRLNEAGIAAATGAPPAITVSWTGTAPQTGCGLAAAFYSGVNQTTPITASRVINGAATTNPPSSPINGISGGYAIYGVNTNATTAGDVSTPAGYTEHFDTANGGLYKNTMGSKQLVSTGTEDPIPTWTSVRYAFAVATIAPASVINTTATGTATAVAAGKDRILVEAPYYDDADADNTLRVEYRLAGGGGYTLWQNMSHASSPYSNVITGLAADTLYDIQVTYQDPDGVTGTAVQTFTNIRTRAGGMVEVAQAWTRVINDATTRTTAGGAVNLNANFAVTAPAGSGRMLVLAITHYNTPTVNTAPAIPSTITYGGTPLTLASSNRATSAVVHTWLYYMKDDAVIMDGSSKTLALSWSGGINSTKLDAYFAVFTNVDQIAPVVSNSRLYNTTSTTNMMLSPALPLAANSLGVYVINDVNITTNGIPTWSPNSNWTTPYSDVATSRFTGTLTGTAAYAHELAQRAIPATATSDNAMTGIRSLSGRYAISAMALPARAVTLTDGANPGDSVIYAGQSAVVDGFTMDGSGTVTSIQVTGNASTTNSSISAIRIYRKGDANVVQYTPGVDVLIGSGTFGAVGTTPVNITLSGTETISGQQDYIIVLEVASGAIANGSSVTFTARVTGTTPAAGTLNDAAAATLTLLPSLTVGNGVEPAAARLWKSSAPTNLNAFTLNHNSINAIDDDTISNITITMTPPFISGGSGGTISKIKLMEITNQAGTVVYGSANLATVGDTWNIPVTGLVATATPTTYYVRIRTEDVITPSAADTSGTLTGFYGPINGKVTSLIHSVGTNQLINNDTTSAALSIDVEKPNGPATASATTGVSPGEINLVWDPVDDTPANGGTMHPTTPVIIRRSVGEGVSPDPGCLGLTDGSTDLATVPGVTINYAGRSVTDINLISDNPTRYYYRVCGKDSLGNISDGAQTYANAKVQNICDRPPTVSLTYEDGSSSPDGLQIIKSANSAPFRLQIANNDIGTCPDVTFTVALANVVGNDSHFTKKIDGGNFPGSVTVGTGGAGASTGKTVNIHVTGIEAAGAQQLETYKFGVHVSSAGDSHGAPIVTQQVTGLLNDMPPIVHNSANMAKYQYGTWGQTYTCATCHSNSTTNIKGVYQIISTPIGKRNVVFTKTSSTTADSNGVYSNDTRAVKNVSNQVCSVCHHKTRQHQYSANKPFGGPNNDEDYNADHHNSRDCIRCHTHNSAFRSIYGLCGDCHGFKATGYSPVNKSTMVKDLTNALGPNPPNYGAHVRHNKALISCGACHSATNHGLATTAWSGDNILEMGFNASKDTFSGWNPSVPVVGGTFYGTNNLNQPFTWGAGVMTNISTIADYNNSCSTYCHGGGSWKAGGNLGSNTTPIWVGTGQAACGTCHNATGAIPPVSGSHAKHAATSGAGLGIACGNCHSTYGSYTGSAHINGKVEWGMAPYPGAAYNSLNSGSTNQPAPTPGGSYKSCTNLYCHSNVQGAGGNGTGGPTSYATALWGGPADCGSCHGCSPQDPLCVAPQASGSHQSHQNAQVNFDCHVCHSNGGTTSPLNHANSIINMQFDGLGANTVYSRGVTVAPGTAYGTCSTGNCHGRYTRSWGTAASALTMCDKCHGSATSPRGFYNTRGPTGTLSIYSAGIGVHDIHLQNLNSPRKATFARFTSFAVGMSCKQCHTMPSGPFTAGHIDSALPAEVPFNNNSSIAGHGKLFGYYSTPTYSFATQSCNNVYCHGAGMHSNRAQDEYVGTTPPAHSVPKWNVPFLTGNGANDCTKCHALPPPAPNSSYVHFGKTLNTCANCHQHVSADGYGFKDKSLHVNGAVEGGCDGCHGNPPTTDVLGPPDGLSDNPAQNALPPGFAGSHNAHQLVPSIGNLCSTCHNGANQAMPSNKLEIGFNMFGLGTSGTFTGYTNSVNGPQWLSSSAGTTIVKSNLHEARCSNLYCHGGGSTSPVRPVLGGGNVLNPSWADALSIQCGDCHGVDAANAPTTSSHPRHALTVASLTCSSCHGETSDNGTHVNAVVNWRLDRANLVFGPNATYNNVSSGSLSGLAPRANGADYRTCNNVYCHSTVQSGDGTGAPTYIQPQWGGLPMTCGTCHNDFATATGAASTGSHEKHANLTTGMNVPCGYCHQDAGASFNALHADRSIFVNFTSYIGGIYSVGTPSGTGVQKIAQSQAFGSCSATFCHGTADSPVWGTPGPLDCNACHSAKVDDVSWSGNHKIHYNYSTMPTSYTQTVQDLSSPTKYRFNCAHCHDDNVSKHSLKPANANAAARVFFGISTATPVTSSRRGTYTYGSPQGSTDNGFNYTNGVCNASYCHSNGRGGAPFNTSLTWTTPKQATANCKLCHDMQYTTSTVSQLSGKHDKHMNPTNNPMIGVGNGFKCRDCHAPTITTFSNYTIANKGRHVNATLNYSGAKSGKNHNGITKVCSNVYCHSNGNPNATIFVAMTTSKAWNGAKVMNTCNNCHGRGNATGYPDYANGGGNTATSNLHEGHMIGFTTTTACADCHRKAAETAVPNRFRPYSTSHMSGVPNIFFNTAKTEIGTRAAAAVAGFQVTCSGIVCHGGGAPIWGAKKTGSGNPGVRTCTKCHGDATAADYLTNYSSATIAPGANGVGTDTTMVNTAATSPRVGAHQRHLLTDMLSSAIKCGECHVPVTNVRNGNHWNYSTATITFRGRATVGETSSFVSRVNGIMQCNNTYCHTGSHNSGTVQAPFWNMTGLVKENAATVGACNKCHAMAPKPGTIGGHVALADGAALSTIVANCQSCHFNISSSASNMSNAFTDKNLHVNGVINYNLKCDSCHDYNVRNGNTWGILSMAGANTEGYGAHVKHIQYLQARYPTFSSLKPATDNWASPNFIKICGACHSTSEAGAHSTSKTPNRRQIIFPGTGQFGAAAPFYNGSSLSSSSAKPKTCSNIDCHYKTSPIWSTY